MVAGVDFKKLLFCTTLQKSAEQGLLLLLSEADFLIVVFVIGAFKLSFGSR